MDLADAITVGTLDFFTKGGKSAVFTPAGGDPVNCKVFINFNVLLQPAGMESQTWQRVTMIEALLSDDAGIGIGTVAPNRLDTFVVGGVTYTVDSIDENDGYTVKVVVI
jgi:hypothetical protein